MGFFDNDNEEESRSRPDIRNPFSNNHSSNRNKVHSSASKIATRGTSASNGTSASGSAASGGATSGGAAGSGTASGGSAGGAAGSGTASGGSAAGGSAAGGAAGGASGGAAGGAAGAGASPVLLVLLVIVFLLFFDIIFEALTPKNASTVAIEYAKTKLQEGVDYIAESVSEFFGRVFGLSEEVEKIEADESQYDINNEYDVGFIQNYNAINTAINAAYKDELEKYISSYCSNFSCSYKKTMQALESKYPNGWRDVYADVNYGEMINILSLGYKTGVYGTDIQEGDTEALAEFLLEEINWSVYFRLEIEAPPAYSPSSSSGSSSSSSSGSSSSSSSGSPSGLISNIPATSSGSSSGSPSGLISNIPATTPSTTTQQPSYTIIQDAIQEGTQNANSNSSTSATSAPALSPYEQIEEYGGAADITIHPYCIKDLFHALNINKDDEYYIGITYYEMLELMKLQDRAICEDESGNCRLIYYTLGLDKPSATWDYSFSNATIEGIFTNSSIIPVSGDNAQIVWAYLKANGFSDEGAAGIMGNLMAENSFRTQMSGEGGSVGLAQWTGSRKDALISMAQSTGRDVTDIYVQAEYLVSELASSKYDCIRYATDVTMAADYTAYYYEACSRYSSYEAYLNGKYAGVISWSRYSYSNCLNTYIIDLTNRQNFSQYYYSLYAGTT